MTKHVKWILIGLICLSSMDVFAAQKTLTTYTWDGNIGIQGSVNMITFENDIEDFTSSAATTGSVIVDTTGKVVNLGNRVTGGSCGVLWYDGTNTIGNCQNGSCEFGTGFRTYFEFRITTTDRSSDSQDYGHGFTFAVLSAENNTTSRRGGAPKANTIFGSGYYLAELLCYAGSDDTSDQLGLQPPKFAVEFDTYPNTSAMTYDGCSRGRNDGNRNHIASVFWGSNRSSTCYYISDVGVLSNPNPLKISYDDNIHGQGTSGSGAEQTPLNSLIGDATGGYCRRLDGRVSVGGTTYNWMEDNQIHRVRIEVTRNDNRDYNIKAWVDCEDACCSQTGSCPSNLCNLSDFENLAQPYTGYAPKINRTVRMHPNLNRDFERMIFGFTQATTGNYWSFETTATQHIEITNFKMYFTP